MGNGLIERRRANRVHATALMPVPGRFPLSEQTALLIDSLGDRIGLHLPVRSRRYFPMQNREKITPSRSSAVNSPVIDDSAFCASRSSSA